MYRQQLPQPDGRGLGICTEIGFDDPPLLAKECKTEEEKLDCYRRVRDEIKGFIEKIQEVLK